MAWALVQTSSYGYHTGVNAGGPALFSATPTVGNLLILIATQSSDAGQTRYAQAPSGWTQSVRHEDISANTSCITIFSKIAGSNEPTSISVTVSLSSITLDYYAFEFSGVDPAFGNSNDASTNGGATSTNTSPVALSYFTTTSTNKTNQLIITACAQPSSSTITWNNTWTNSFSNLGSAQRLFNAGYRAGVPSGTYSTTTAFNGSQSSGGFIFAYVVFNGISVTQYNKSIAVNGTSLINNNFMKTLNLLLLALLNSTTSLVKKTNNKIFSGVAAGFNPIKRVASTIRRVNPISSLIPLKSTFKNPILNVFSTTQTFIPKLTLIMLNVLGSLSTSMSKMIQPINLVNLLSSINISQQGKKILATPVVSTINRLKNIFTSKLVAITSGITFSAIKIYFKVLTVLTNTSGLVSQTINKITFILPSPGLILNQNIFKNLLTNILAAPSIFKGRFQTFLIIVNEMVSTSVGRFYPQVISVIVTNSTTLLNLYNKLFSILSNSTVLISKRINQFIVIVSSILIQINQFLKQLISVISQTLISIKRDIVSQLLVLMVNVFGDANIIKQINKGFLLSVNYLNILQKDIFKIVYTVGNVLINNRINKIIRMLLITLITASSNKIKNLNFRVLIINGISSDYLTKIIGSNFFISITSLITKIKSLGQNLLVNPISSVFEGTPRQFNYIVNVISSVNLIKQIKHPFSVIVTNTTSFSKRIRRVIQLNSLNTFSMVKNINRRVFINPRPLSSFKKFITKSVSVVIVSLPLARKMMKHSIQFNVTGSVLDKTQKCYGVQRVKAHKTITLNLAFDRPVDAWVVKLDTDEEYSSGTTLASYFGAPVTTGIAIFSSDLLLPKGNDVKVYARTAGTRFWSD